MQTSRGTPADHGGVVAALLRACESLRREELARASSEIDWVLGHSGDPDLRLLAARLCWCVGQYGRALAELRRLADDHPHLARSSLAAALGLSARLGLDQDTRSILEAALRSDPRNARLHRVGVKLYGRRVPELAIEHARRALAIDADQPALRMELAGLAAFQGDLETARREVSLSLRAARSRPYMLEAARILFDLADLDAAREVLLNLLRGDPSDIDARVALARLELAAGRWDAARALADEILTGQPDHPSGLWLLGALNVVVDGRLDEALRMLNRSIELDPTSDEAFAWRADAHLRAGDAQRCREDAHRASMLRGQQVPARLLHLLASTGPNDPAPRVYAARTESVRAAVLELCPGADAALDSELHERVVPVLRRALTRLGANRSSSPTWIDDTGSVRRLMARGGIRSTCRAVLERIRCQPAALVLEHFDELLARHPDSALPLCHRGELHLWLGDVASARADFEAAIRTRAETRFAYIGLAGCALLEGDAELALAESDRGIQVMHGSSGPAVFAYRGEALYRLGRLDEAVDDLERCLSLSTTRIGTRIALAIVRAHRDGLDGIGPRFTEVAARAPGLVADAAEGIATVSHRLPLPPEAQLAVLQRALLMLRGNRSSSCHTYFTQSGTLRTIPGHGGGRAHVHARDATELDHVEAILKKRLAADRRRSVARGRGTVEPPPRAPLTPADVEGFLRDGYLALRGAIPRQTCRELIERLHERLLTAPERWAPGLDAAAREQLRSLRPDEPDSWPTARLDVPGERAIPIAELSADVWGAICQLLGGAERVRTRAWSDAFVLNLRDLREREWAPPTASQNSWHFDDPGRADTLGELRRGLFAIIYLSSVSARGGATFIAPESVPLTIRWMASSPAGIDLLDRSSGPRVTSRCKRFVELTGEAGDVFLVHPLMAHSSSGNVSGRVRYMMNPMVYLHEPLRLDRRPPDHLSPLEESFRRALEPHGRTAPSSPDS